MRMAGGALRVTAAALFGIGLAAALTAAEAADKVTMGTNWKAQAEHGGYYQALAEGIYEKYGLDVTIRPGGPQVNHAALLAAGRIDFNMAGNVLEALNFVQSGVPMVAIAAIFQKEPQVLLAHPGTGIGGFEDLEDKTVLLSNDGRVTFWLWLQQAYGLTDEQVKPYTFNAAPFIADKNAVQQAYVTAEPFTVKEQGGFEPQVLMMADAGYDTYASVLETSQKMIDENPELVQRFVDATIEGWYGYLYGDNSKANELIKADNPDITDAQIAFSIDQMKKYGIVDSGDALEQGIGVMTDERWQSFFGKTVGWGIYPADLPYEKAYTTQFVGKGHGLDLKKKLTGE